MIRVHIESRRVWTFCVRTRGMDSRLLHFAASKGSISSITMLLARLNQIQSETLP